MRQRRAVLVILAPLGVAALIASCGDSGAPASASSTSSGAGGTTSGAGGGGDLLDAGGGCQSDLECDGGVCNQGVCCGSAELVCGDLCCSSGQVCLFNQCVAPGGPCITAADCPDGEYCEPALGDGASGSGGMGGGACSEPLPQEGKCLPLPPVCDEDADAGADAGVDCIEKCEYFPPTGQLNVVRKWQWGYDPVPTSFPSSADVWATPTVGRLYDANCDGKVDLSDPPNVVFVSGDAKGTFCHNVSPSACRNGVLRMLNGRTGQEIWSQDNPGVGTMGFAANSVALGDIDGDQRMDVVALSGDGYVVLLDAEGQVMRVSDKPVDGEATSAFGWGGGLSLGDMDGDGAPEIAFGRTLFATTGGTITRAFKGAGGWGSPAADGSRAISYFTDLDGDGKQELVAGRTAYRKDGSTLWDIGGATLPDGFTAVGDFDQDGKPEIAHVSGGVVRILSGLTGAEVLPPVTLNGVGSGGPPTVADFDGDGLPEIGVAQQDKYSMLKPNFVTSTIDILWEQQNHDLSSSVTGSSVFDFEGDGKAEVIYNDECFLWVYDGATGNVRFATLTQSFTATEASLVADVDGDGHAEIVMVSNSANPAPKPTGWGCDEAPWNQPDPVTGRPAWVRPPPPATDYRGITVFGDAQSSWVGTRTLWNQHAYHVSNICDPRDSACLPGSYYGQIPPHEVDNWTVPWLNNFRQNVQDKNVFDAPDATISLDVACKTPLSFEVSIRNLGQAGLPSGVSAGVYIKKATDVLLGTVVTEKPLLPGQTEVIPFVDPTEQAALDDTFIARILIDAQNPTFHECRTDNNESLPVTAGCAQ